MFTGIIQASGVIEEQTGGRLTIAPSASFSTEDLIAGESIAVDGCCLTLLAAELPLRFDLSDETLHRTTFGKRKPGDSVNLERAMRAGDRFGGHFVQGHVDAMGELIAIVETDKAHIYRFSCPTEYEVYLVDKGSIAVDGISLTVVNPILGMFDAWIVPHTLTHTTLGVRKPGDWVNLEFDVLAKYVVSVTQHHVRPGHSS